MTQIKAGLKYVHNLGNYQTVAIDVSVEDSKRPDETDDEAFQRIYSFVENKLVEKTKEIINTLEK